MSSGSLGYCLNIASTIGLLTVHVYYYLNITSIVGLLTVHV